jgi:hypothetical protein
MGAVSLLFQPSLFGSGEPVADASFSTIHRVQLDAESWVDVAPGWLCGPDTLFTELAESASWDQRERRMYDHRVAEPRLTCGWGVDEAPPPLGDLAALLSDRYQVHFNSIWANYYRHGGTRWPGTAIGCVSPFSARGWPSSRWAVPGVLDCGRAAVARGAGSPWRVGTCS